MLLARVAQGRQGSLGETMMAASRCPTATELASLLIGSLSEAEAPAFEVHVLHCGTCLEQLKVLERRPDTLAAMPVGDTQDDLSSSPVVADLIERLKGLRPTSSTSAGAVRGSAWSSLSAEDLTTPGY